MESRVDCHLVYPFLWNGHRTEASIWAGVLNMEYEVAPAGGESDIRRAD